MASLDEMLFGFFLMIFLIVLNAFFVAAEFAFVTVRRTRMEELAAQGSRSAKQVLTILDHLDEYINSAQVGITLASIGLGWIAEPLMELVFEDIFHIFLPENVVLAVSVASGYLLITYLHVVIGEVTPKSIALQFSERASLSLALPMIMFTKLISPLLWVFNATNRLLLRLLRIDPRLGSHMPAMTEEELKKMVSISEQQGVIEASELEVILRVFKLGDQTARDIMTARPFMTGMEINTPYEEVVKIAKETGYSRYPVYENELDNILGVFHVKDLTCPDFDPASFKIKDHLRDNLNVPESKTVYSLLKRMQESRTQLAAVFDEFGVLSGIVTLEDILEELVGPIEDEYDQDREPEIKLVGENTYLVDGTVHIDDLNKELGIEIESDEVISAAGFVVEQLDRIPQVGAKLIFAQYQFEVLEIVKNRIHLLKVTKLDAE
ncbi:MAG: hemolysin family protein [Candidatus Hodarchaeales archaeon]|jgi:CBS domain containing-hemolysin-like protein